MSIKEDQDQALGTSKISCSNVCFGARGESRQCHQLAGGEVIAVVLGRTAGQEIGECREVDAAVESTFVEQLPLGRARRALGIDEQPHDGEVIFQQLHAAICRVQRPVDKEVKTARCLHREHHKGRKLVNGKGAEWQPPPNQLLGTLMSISAHLFHLGRRRFGEPSWPSRPGKAQKTFDSFAERTRWHVPENPEPACDRRKDGANRGEWAWQLEGWGHQRKVTPDASVLVGFSVGQWAGESECSV